MDPSRLLPLHISLAPALPFRKESGCAYHTTQWLAACEACRVTWDLGFEITIFEHYSNAAGIITSILQTMFACFT